MIAYLCYNFMYDYRMIYTLFTELKSKSNSFYERLRIYENITTMVI